MYVTHDVNVNNTHAHDGREEGGNVNLQAGWNLVIHEILDTSNGSSRNYTAPLDSLKWVWNPTSTASNTH